jgi:hypothetical protein
MMSDIRCPTCCGPKVVAGLMRCQENVASSFLPMSAGSAFPTKGIPVPHSFLACLGCGHLWSAIDPQRLRDFLGASGQELARQEIDEIDRGPGRDLPDTEWGRMVGGRISELDALAREGGTALLRRYRDMRGVTWDIAAKEARHWHRLPRAEKMALFGWVPKTKSPKDDLGELLTFDR